MHKLCLLCVALCMGVDANPGNRRSANLEEQSKITNISADCGGPFRIAKLSQKSEDYNTVYVNAREGQLEEVTRQVYSVCEADHILMTLPELQKAVDDAEGKSLKGFTQQVSAQLVSSRKLTGKQVEKAKTKISGLARQDLDRELQGLTASTDSLLKRLKASQ